MEKADTIRKKRINTWRKTSPIPSLWFIRCQPERPAGSAERSFFVPVEQVLASSVLSRMLMKFSDSNLTGNRVHFSAYLSGTSSFHSIISAKRASPLAWRGSVFLKK